MCRETDSSSASSSASRHEASPEAFRSREYHGHVRLSLGECEPSSVGCRYRRPEDGTAERRHMQLHGAGIQLLLLKQVGLILAQVLWTEPVGRLMEMPGELLDDPDVGFYGTLSVITTLEFFQHHFAKSGHRDLL